MKIEAIVFTAAGGTEVISLGATEIREPGMGEVVVEIVAAGLNRADILQRRGLYPAPAGSAANVPGLEFAGVVAKCGTGVTRWQVGDRVMAITGGGAMARAIVIHERELLAVPAALELSQAAAIPEAFLTAWDAFSQANLRSGETALIHAAASGVGTAALQLCRAWQVRAIATVRTPDKLAKLAAFGLSPNDGIVVRGGAFAAEVASKIPNGVNVVLDCVGAAYFDENLRACSHRGRVVLLGTMGGASGSASFGMMLAKRLTVIGTVMRARPLEQKIMLAQGASNELLPLFATKVLAPVVDQVLPMAQCAQAHQLMEANGNVGKIVLAW